MLNLRQIILLIVFLPIVHIQAHIHFNESEYQDRLAAYRTLALEKFSTNSIPIQAYEGVPVDQKTLQDIIQKMNTSGEIDFSLVQLVRILFFSHGQYDSLLLPAIKSIPLWLTPNETTRVYWSENHITMWLSSAWLLQEKYGIGEDPELRKKLIHCLDLKNQYGFYEFFSSVYFPYTLSGLLNLSDFAQDQEIRDKAIAACKRLLSFVLLLVNDQGVLFPAAGRNYESKYIQPYGQNHSDLIYLLTGLGEKPTKVNHAAAFLATSRLDVESIVDTWTPNIDTIIHHGHSVEMLKSLGDHLLPTDQVIFHWSCGAYFHPLVALQTAQLLHSYHLWDHKEFKSFKDFKSIPVQLAPTLAQAASSISESSVISQADIYVYKNHSITLSSLQDFWKGKAGFQQWPWAATTGTIAVTTKSGKIDNQLGDENLSGNSNLPYIKQKENVALIMYRPKKDLKFYGYKNHDVRLLWEENKKYDEVVEYGKWIIGREGNSYIAVLRHCTDKIDGIYGCTDQDGQLWACVVGNQEMYGSFQHFIQVIHQAKYQEKWYYVFSKAAWHYYGMVEVDGKLLTYDWEEDLTGKPDDPTTEPLVTSIKTYDSSPVFQVYPNPAQDDIVIQIKENHSTMPYQIKIFDTHGRVVLDKIVSAPYESERLSITQFPSGLYFLQILSEGKISQKPLVIQH